MHMCREGLGLRLVWQYLSESPGLSVLSLLTLSLHYEVDKLARGRELASDVQDQVLFVSGGGDVD